MAITIENALIISIESLLRWRPLPKNSVTSTADLVDQLKPFFSEAFLSHLSSSALSFDNLASTSTDSICDVFFAMSTTATWLYKIAYAMAAAAERVADSELHPRRTHADAVMSQTERDRIIAGPTTQSTDDSTTAPSPEALLSCPIVDIALSGASIKDAWYSNAMTRAMEFTAIEPVLCNPQWTPAESTLPCYHATTSPALNTMAQYAHEELSINMTYSNVTPDTVLGVVARNQMVPAFRALPMIYTGFSPLRCVLWAMFHSDVISNIPISSAAMSNLAYAWPCPRPPEHQHRGVRLLKFSPDPAAMSTISTFVLPNGLQDQWVQRVREIGGERHDP